ncbi:MAG TPA: DUF5686 and carboxypeptidase regulatory-like domain-containing protein [Chryseosolibacter sp.]
MISAAANRQFNVKHYRKIILIVLLLLAWCFAASPSVGQTSGIHGVISDERGAPLAFATIFVKQLGSGTTANAEGAYEIFMPPGRYELVFQHLGRRSVVRVVDIAEALTELNITLVPQEIMLPSVTVNADDEDPAYSIMRKAIAKANYHRNVLDSYSAKVYIKGAGKLKDYPWLAKKALKKEGIEKNRVFISESVSEIKFTRPNKFEEKVISIRSDGKDNNTSPNGYIFGSFYEPEVAGTVSPLSPKAFSYYRFEYLGSFHDREYEVSRIRVTPRSKGENVVDGIIFIVENDWSIHSLDIHTVKLGIDIYIKVMCGPIGGKVWLPVSHRFDVQGKVFGFEFEYNYQASVSNYNITLNPEIYVSRLEVIDEKTDEALAGEVEAAQRELNKGRAPAEKTRPLQDRLAAGEEITRKELKSIVKEYEKEERKQQKDPEILSEVNFKIDSGAFRKDSLYWAQVRPIPLTREEIKGYEKTDSISAVEKAKSEGDTLRKSRHQGFQPWDILTGDDYRLGRHSNFRIYFPIGGFNTVEGFNLIYRVAFGVVLQDTNRTRFTIRPVARYAFSRRKLSGYLNFALRNNNDRLDLNGGQYVSQYNPDNPIHPFVNTFTTLFLERNLMKIYERNFVDVRYRRRINPFLTISTYWSWSQRMELFNESSFKLVDRKNIEDYTPNAPVNETLGTTDFPDHKAFVGSVAVSTRPWLKFRMRNGNKREIESSSPAFTLEYRKGFNDVLQSDVNFDQLELGIKHEFKVGARGDVDFWLRGGVFLNNKAMYFMDYKHFLGNQTPFSTTDPVGSFRLLDYYRFSTNDRYVTLNAHYQFRKFLVTTLPVVRLAGIRENIFVNYLATPASGNYTELGYSIDGILRFLRLEAAASFRDGQFLDYGFRLGIATNIGVDFSD